MLKVPRRSALEKYMPKVLGWDRSIPLPEKFTAWPDPYWKKREDRLIIVEDNMSELNNNILRPTVIDLFSGCGGFSCGFVKAGFRVVASVEYAYWPHITYCSNIPHLQQYPLHAYTCDIKDLTGREILINAGLKEVDVVIGSPPCQSFSMAGKREIGDPRDNLLWEFGRLVKELQPKQWLMENVPGMKSKKFANGKSVLEEFQKYMEDTTISDLNSVLTKERIGEIIIDMNKAKAETKSTTS